MATTSSNGRGGAVKKTRCPLTREDFRKGARLLMVNLDGHPLVAEVKEKFSTGSFGWFHGGKVVLQVGDKPVTVQVGLNLTVVGSKDAS
jgi:hypothetical protein